MDKRTDTCSYVGPTPDEERGMGCSLIRAPWLYRSELGLLILRLGAGGMMFCHGWAKLGLLIHGGGAGWMDPLGIGSGLSLALCVFAEFVCSLAVLVGFFTRLAAMVLVINFWVIIFIYGSDSLWPQSELPMLYLTCFITLVCTGAGPFSVDRRIWNDQ